MGTPESGSRRQNSGVGKRAEQQQQKVECKRDRMREEVTFLLLTHLLKTMNLDHGGILKVASHVVFLLTKAASREL